MGENRLAVRRWPIWSLRRRVLYYVLCVEVAAAVTAVYTAFLYPVTSTDWQRIGVLAACAVVHIEATRSTERKNRLAVSSGPYIDQKNVWNFAAMLIAPPALATVMILFTYTYAWVRTWWANGNYPCYRWIYSAATVVIGTQVAVAVLVVGIPGYPALPAGASELLVVAAAGGVRWLLNYALVLLVLALWKPQLTARELLGNFRDQFIVVGALASGFCVAVLVVVQPLYVLAAVVALLATRRTTLVRHYEQAARTDPKTGLLNCGSWRTQAEQVITRARDTGEQVGILMADLDHFKSVNDTHGHLAGDEVLVTVAGSVTDSIRKGLDTAGRLGGEEFAILLPGTTRPELLATAERIRTHVAAAHVATPSANGRVAVTVSIGAALYPHDGDHLDELLLRADNALYEAKRLGRNRVHLYTENS